ncbi:hypothetical protein HC928_15860 [bacterium]|nr:hypothetical protein [bacterium]
MTKRLVLLVVLMFAVNVVWAQEIPIGYEIPDGQGIWEVSWNPDGTMYAAANPGGKIYLYDAVGVPLRALSGHMDRAIDLEWSADGTILARVCLQSVLE